MAKVLPVDEGARRLKLRERMQIVRRNVRRHRGRSRQDSRCTRRGLFRGRRRLGSERLAGDQHDVVEDARYRQNGWR